MNISTLRTNLHFFFAYTSPTIGLGIWSFTQQEFNRYRRREWMDRGLKHLLSTFWRENKYKTSPLHFMRIMFNRGGLIQMQKVRQQCQGSLHSMQSVHIANTGENSSKKWSQRTEVMFVCVWKSLSHVQLCDPMDTQSMGFSRPEYRSGWPFPSPGDLPNPGIEPRSPALQENSLPAEPPGKPRVIFGGC